MILRVHLLKLGTVKQREGLREKRQDRSNRSETRLGCLDSRKEVSEAEGESMQTGSGVSLGRAATAHYLPCCKSRGDP